MSVIIVLPSKLSTIPSYSFLYFTKSDATPIIFPSGFIFSNFLPRTVDIGKNDALPNLFTLRYSTSFLASPSFSVTIFCILAPKHISIAVLYFSSVETIFASTPCIPFFKAGLLSQAINNSLTDFVYPSFSFSVSTKKLYLLFFNLCSSTALFIFISISFICLSRASFSDLSF